MIKTNLRQIASDRAYAQAIALSVSAETLDWVTRQVGRGAQITSVRRLHGGSSTVMHAVGVRDRRGSLHELVLRRFVRPNWKYPGLPRREANVLGVLERAGYPAPRLVALDDGPEQCDVRAVLMTRLPGRVELAPKRIDPWLRQIAQALPPIHAIPLPEIRPYRPYTDPREVEPPEWTRGRRAWQRVLDLARSRQPRTAPRFIHRDYHPGNILWSRGRITGVVDWISACAGPPQIDVAHCRVNLVRLHGVAVADAFLAHYACASGTSVADYDPYWDAIALADTGFEPRIDVQIEHNLPPGLTPAKIRRQLDAYARDIASRV